MKPETYGKWIYHLARRWNPPDGVDLPTLLGFVVILATFGRDGQSIHPSAAALAEATGWSESTCKRWRAKCVRLGVLHGTGKTYRKVPDLEFAIPPNAGEAAEWVSAPIGATTEPEPQAVDAASAPEAAGGHWRCPCPSFDCPVCREALLGVRHGTPEYERIRAEHDAAVEALAA